MRRWQVGEAIPALERRCRIEEAVTPAGQELLAVTSPRRRAAPPALRRAKRVQGRGCGLHVNDRQFARR